MTGPDLVRRIETAARARRVSTYALARRFAPANPTAWLETMRATRRPRSTTVARVERALEEA